jgi:hypothetical protein
MMNTLVMKKLCGVFLLTGLICGAALAQQPYGTVTPPGTDSATGTTGGVMPGAPEGGVSGGAAGGSTGGSTGDTSSGTSGAPGTDQAAPMPGAPDSSTGAPGSSAAPGTGSSGDTSSGASGVAGIVVIGSEGPDPALLPETPGAAGPSDADPYKAMTRGGMKPR